MEKTIEELILQELREIKGAVNSLGNRMDKLETRMDALGDRMDKLETRMDALGDRMDKLETRMDSLEDRMDTQESRINSLGETIADMAENIAEIRIACNSLLDWAERVYAIEHVKDKNFPRIGGLAMSNIRDNAVGEKEARYYVESNGKRTYY